ncbi:MULTISPECIES: TVP38/TMEM64 family protein [unclassified Paenibacillus]|uniref:TVP38/TMEM64 family protein n=1 Tax=unclassified Paenibacillus TaxID=185978 RepID=UPI001AE16A61|nr:MULTISPECIES: TVP38/TMEM64 family protein [unclassified Paenibacillus]MBP1155547.1 putative membrane protein YdjX (TVP38/TMEM64 family) [Paenibacillus sp. PvP091]MBP1169067.1 putative membrane protein YdjX (TVP38/TMEM64 family) [Paenibacillus sp. PvR098]MBP2440095.1 putative membrane protein YdjX (TVP38/TMEM64 family) [Paenibacillus sp. PvP052]
MVKKLGLAILYIGIAFMIYIYGEVILAWFQQTTNVTLVMLIATLMALFPVIPYPIVGGVIGAAFGPVLGGVITWVGSTLASILMFLFVRYGYQEWGERVLHSRNSLGKITVLFEKNAFLTILFTRLIPFVPSIVVNIYSALSRVSFTAYAIASSIGKIPAMLLFALIGDSLMTEPRNIVVTIGVYGAFLGITLLIYNIWKKSRGQAVQNQEVT